MTSHRCIDGNARNPRLRPRVPPCISGLCSVDRLGQLDSAPLQGGWQPGHLATAVGWTTCPSIDFNASPYWGNGATIPAPGPPSPMGLALRNSRLLPGSARLELGLHGRRIAPADSIQQRTDGPHDATFETSSINDSPPTSTDSTSIGADATGSAGDPATTAAINASNSSADGPI